MMVTEILVALATIANGVWFVINVRIGIKQEKEFSIRESEITRLYAEANHHLRTAKEFASTTQEHKVCDVCKRIVVQHATENGVTTCVNCASDLAKRAS